METTKIENLTEDEFHKKFKRQKNQFDNNASFDGCLFETYGIELDYVYEMSKNSRVLTIIEGDEELEETFIDSSGVEITETIPNMYYASGFHFVNRMGYFVLDKPYENEFEVKVE
ncbi:hypothetical protein [Parasediminibacterium sp. JCM 36343]|uniref:hypothetical protein n=1 Tax=Parasediminibacterium sp. JCM 36343 TaxID=3374279 RepID=UPI00397ACC23